ncbi:D-2-hydroxyacid dehydrogenase [Clostridium mediterraneense]|uniref:D-2-hydroxyacid dehydrogenase n=1 Tax=Clostridium mediterraneense TaxID=1805472 RepID=UPI000830BFF1|nr:D-2-hydroxyacid dehydrogenase [Clostridium mediterraneense]
MIRVLFCDGVEKNLSVKIENLGVEVVDKHYEEAELGEEIKNFDVAVVRSATKIRKNIIDKAKGSKLKLIIRAGVGVDNIDVDYAKQCGLEVRNTPNASSDSVAELVIAHIFSLARFLNQSNVSMRDGEWNKKKYKGIEIVGKTLGIIGMGRIGESLAKKAKALGMNIIYFDLLGKKDGVEGYINIDELYRTSDFISIHVPTTKTLISDNEINKMKDGVYIINTARGTVIDEKALIKALDSNKIAGAGIDVFESEPNFSEELVSRKNVSVTPHIGASTKEAQDKIGDEIVNIIKEKFNL